MLRHGMPQHALARDNWDGLITIYQCVYPNGCRERLHPQIVKQEVRMLWGIVSWIVIGALAGWVASLIMGTNDRQGCLLDIVVGIVGAFIGGLCW